MTKSQIDFDDEETQIIEAFLFLYGATDKKDAVKKLIRKYKEFDKKIPSALAVKKKVK